VGEWVLIRLAAVPPNVLCVVLDTARADALEPYGAAPGATPVLAQLASSGTAAPSAYAAASWTLPSHAAMFTGLLPRATGIGLTEASPADANARMHTLSNRVLPEALRQVGYRTGGVTTNLWVSERTGFSVGFDDFVEINTGRQGKIRNPSLRARIQWGKEILRARVDDGAVEAERVLGRWIDAIDPGEPFFWFVNLIECHSPYLPPLPYNDLSPAARLRAGFEARRHLTLEAIWKACVADFDIPDDALDRMRRLYEGSVRYMDDWLGRILDALERRGALDDTIVMVTSDHGENFGEGGLMAHCFSLDDRLIHVPFVVHGPHEAVDLDGILSLAELPRLVAELAGVEDHPWNGDLPDGVALSQLDPPVLAGDPRATDIARDWGLDEGGFEQLTTPFVSATDGRRKLIRRQGRDLLVDLAEDPLELSPRDILRDPPSVGDADAIDALRRALDHPAMAATGLEPAAVGTTPEHPAATAEETEDLEERMRLLGYL
jgi:arylsulfatase A-like enzyme